MQSIVNEQIISDTVHNGIHKIKSNKANFMTELDILKVIKMIKPKNCEGHDRIPKRILLDGISNLITPLATLFNKIKTHYKLHINLKNCKIVNNLIQYQQHKIHPLEIQELNQSTIKIKFEFKIVLDHHNPL